MFDIWDNLGPRVRYGDFYKACRALVLGQLERQGVSAATLNLECRGTTASISVRRSAGTIYAVELNLPGYSPDRIITGELARSIIGYLVHELAHLAYTDTGALMGNLPYGSHRFVNVAEDHFIEYRASNPAALLYGNAPALLGALNDRVQAGAAPAMAVAVARGAIERQAQILMLTGLNRRGRQGAALAGELAMAEAAAKPEVLAVVDELRDKLERLSDRSRDPVGDTLNRRKWALEAFDKLKALQVEEDKQPKGESTLEELEASAQFGQPDNAQRQQEALQALQPADVGTTERELAAELLPLEVEEDKAGAIEIKGGVPQSGRPAPQDLARVANQIEALARLADMGAIASAARRVLQSVEVNRRIQRLQSGRMDRRGLVRAAMGARDVFSRREHSPGVQTAVQIMVDMSGSMDSNVPFQGRQVGRDEAAVACASALASALERAGVLSAVAFFADVVGADGNGQPVESQPGREVVPVKRFNRRAPQADTVGVLAGPVKGWGNTPMLRPAVWAEVELGKQRATRLVCIWLTDGRPDESAAVLRAIMGRKGNPVEHVGIGISCDVGTVFERCARVNQMDMLPAALLGALTNA